MPLTETIGAATLDGLAYVGGLARLTGGALRAVFILPFQGKKFHVGRAIHQAMSVGVEALPITSLISFFVGTILAVNAASELRKLGALHFVASGVAIAITRELGPLMTAIVVIGRSGSAFAAEIGTMKVNEEIDAMETMALEPVQFVRVFLVAHGFAVDDVEIDDAQAADSRRKDASLRIVQARNVSDDILERQ